MSITNTAKNSHYFSHSQYRSFGLALLCLLCFSFFPANKAQAATVEQQITILNQTYSTGSTSYTPTDNTLGLFHWDADAYSGATVYFEVYTGATFYQGYAALFTAGGDQVADSEVTKGFTRSSAITLTDDTDYTIRVKAQSSSAPVSITLARLIIVQDTAGSIANTQTQIELGNSEGVPGSTYAPLAGESIYYYDSSKFSPRPNRLL